VRSPARVQTNSGLRIVHVSCSARSRKEPFKKRLYHLSLVLLGTSLILDLMAHSLHLGWLIHFLE
jgi:hypothetical protein